MKLARAILFGVIVALGLAAKPALAAYPDRQVRWLIGFAPGGPVDIVARIMAQWLSERFGQQFVVENRTGSGGNIAAAAMINAPPDGYTLLFVAPNNAISTSLYKKLPYDFIRDTVPVASIMQLTNMLVVSNDVPARTVKDFIDYCRANPGKIAFASSGNGTSVHMAAELFKAMTKCDMLHVPYRGSALAFPDIISNKVQLIFDNLPTALEQARGGYIEVNRSATLDWDALRQKIARDGMRNSNCVAIAPTATISNIIGVDASIEPCFGNLSVKSNLSGEFTIINHGLVKDLKRLGLWDDVMVMDLKHFDGSLRPIDRVADRIAEYICNSTVRDFEKLHGMPITNEHETFYTLIVGLISLIRLHPDIEDTVIRQVAAQTLHLNEYM